MSNIKSEQTKLIEVLEELLRLPENKDCVDCGTKAPRWASTNLGVFMCLRCSGIHRSLGVHVSKVKSVSLDKWTPSQVDVMKQWGNKRANDYYEETLPSDFNRSIELTSNSQLERFIRDKYERKMFIGRGGRPAPGGAPKPQRTQDRPRADPSVSAPPTQVQAKREVVGGNHHAAVPSIQAPKKPAQQQPEPDLVSWDAPHPTTQPQQPQQQTPNNGNDFGLFISANEGPSIAMGEEIQNSLLDEPNLRNPSNPPKADKNSILSLYNQPPMSAVPVTVAPSPYAPNGMPVNPMGARYPVYSTGPQVMRPPVYGVPNPGGFIPSVPNMMVPPGGYPYGYPAGIPNNNYVMPNNNLGIGSNPYVLPNNTFSGLGGINQSSHVSIPPSHPPATTPKAPAVQLVAGSASSSFQQSMSASGFKL